MVEQWRDDLAEFYAGAPELLLGAPMGGIDETAVIGRCAQDRKWMTEHGSLPPAELFPVVDPTARICALVTIDSGTVRPTTIGARTFCMASVHIGHDSLVGDRVEIAPNTTLCGHVEVGDDVRIGCNVSVLPYRRIGAGARVGAGSVVTHDIPAGEVWAGNPARKLRDA